MNLPLTSRVPEPTVVAPSFTVTAPVAVPAVPDTVTLTELADPKAEGSGACTAETVGFTLGSATMLKASVRAPLSPP